MVTQPCNYGHAPRQPAHYPTSPEVIAAGLRGPSVFHILYSTVRKGDLRGSFPTDRVRRPIGDVQGQIHDIMLKQFTILGIVLLIAGSIGLVRTLPYHSEWAAMGFTPKTSLLGEPPKVTEAVQEWPVALSENPQDLNDELVTLRGMSPGALKTQQQARLQAEIDRLAAGERPDPTLARTLYGGDWQEQVARYKTGKERSESILTGSFVLALTGLIVFGWCLLLGLARLVIRIACWLWERITRTFRRSGQVQQQPPSPEAAEDEVVCVQESGRPRAGRPEGGRPRLAVDVGTAPADDEPIGYQRTYPSDEDAGDQAVLPCVSEAAVERLLADDQSRPAASARIMSPALEPAEAEPDDVEHAEVTVVAEPVEPAVDAQGSLAVQTADLERQLARFKEMVQTVPCAETPLGPESSEPFNKTLLQLNEQISAIREYAAEQQERVEKLQSGYDWNIIRTFCLRVIRCIDNLEDRIARCSEQGESAESLDQIREELLFALESSGVEPFEPPLQSVFRGQERWAEAIKDRQACDDPRLKGCVAAVVKPGYQYVVDDQNVKVVRAARVRLYG